MHPKSSLKVQTLSALALGHLQVPSTLHSITKREILIIWFSQDKNKLEII